MVIAVVAHTFGIVLPCSMWTLVNDIFPAVWSFLGLFSFLNLWLAFIFFFFCLVIFQRCTLSVLGCHYRIFCLFFSYDGVRHAHYGWSLSKWEGLLTHGLYDHGSKDVLFVFWDEVFLELQNRGLVLFFDFCQRYWTVLAEIEFGLHGVNFLILRIQNGPSFRFWIWISAVSFQKL